MKWLPQTDEPATNNANLCQFKSHREVGQPGQRDFVDNGVEIKCIATRREEARAGERWFKDRVIDEIFAQRREDLTKNIKVIKRSH